ncbi:Hsp20/alpha crystallin family protein [Methanoculleus sp. Wushi-C6]|uniref:Hsp20/alpha crystallin family protein n=1 Tax=Methanoculleus caldifontis TaxID=2651577 RepID=A0ABU3X3F2_9EURY|nr:Hsp20/alpha crystallin family protein [Methanoculleus sp. Wushi-C6]MDV2482573.1 Hsp20/alpha crystallin family protein [Methanoculleus sp. Wushi-C6]
MSDSPADIFEQLNDLMKRLMEQGLKEQGDQNRPFAYGFKIVLHEAGKIETPAEEKKAVAAPAEPSSEGTIEPIAEMYTTDDDVTVAIDLPGVEKETIHLSLINGTLTIIAGTSQLTSIEVPAVDPDSMRSNYKHGVLEVKFSRGKSIRID